MRGFLATLLLLTLFIRTPPLHGQTVSIGVPHSVYFNQDEYQGGRQNWGFDQDERGRLFVANNNGLLVFNGSDWQILPLPNRTIVRSVKAGQNQRVYAGGQGLFGYFLQVRIGAWEFHDLSALLPKSDQQFDDVWEIVSRGNEVYFRTTTMVIRYANDSLSVIHRTQRTSSLAYVGTSLWLHNLGEGLLRFQEGRFSAPASNPILPESEVVEILSYGNDALLLVTFVLGELTGET